MPVPSLDLSVDVAEPEILDADLAVCVEGTSMIWDTSVAITCRATR